MVGKNESGAGSHCLPSRCRSIIFRFSCRSIRNLILRLKPGRLKLLPATWRKA